MLIAGFAAVAVAWSSIVAFVVWKIMARKP
jgi:hypothetical protein